MLMTKHQHTAKGQVVFVTNVCRELNPTRHESFSYLDVLQSVQLHGSLLRQATGAVLHRGEDRGGNVDVVALQEHKQLHRCSRNKF